MIRLPDATARGLLWALFSLINTQTATPQDVRQNALDNGRRPPEVPPELQPSFEQGAMSMMESEFPDQFQADLIEAIALIGGQLNPDLDDNASLVEALADYMSRAPWAGNILSGSTLQAIRHTLLVPSERLRFENLVNMGARCGACNARIQRGEPLTLMGTLAYEGFKVACSRCSVPVHAPCANPRCDSPPRRLETRTQNDLRPRECQACQTRNENPSPRVVTRTPSLDLSSTWIEDVLDDAERDDED